MTILGSSAFGCVHVSHDLDARNDRLLDVARNRHDPLQFAVDSIADSHLRLKRLEVDIASAGIDGPG